MQHKIDLLIQRTGSILARYYSRNWNHHLFASLHERTVDRLTRSRSFYYSFKEAPENLCSWRELSFSEWNILWRDSDNCLMFFGISGLAHWNFFFLYLNDYDTNRYSGHFFFFQILFHNHSASSLTFPIKELNKTIS